MPFLDSLKVLLPICRISHCTPTWLQEVIAGDGDNPAAQELLAKLTINASTQGHFSLTNDDTKGVFGWTGIPHYNSK